MAEIVSSGVGDNYRLGLLMDPDVRDKARPLSGTHLPGQIMLASGNEVLLNSFRQVDLTSLPGRDKYQWVSGFGGFVATPQEGIVSILPVDVSASRTNDRGEDVRISDVLDSISEILKEELALQKIAFVARPSVHSTTFEGLSRESLQRKTASGVIYPDLKEAVRKAMVEFIDQHPLVAEGKIAGLDVFGPRVLIFRIDLDNDTKDEEGLTAEQRYASWRQAFQHFLEERVPGYKEHVRNSIDDIFSYQPHITVGYFVDTLNEQQARSFLERVQDFNARFSPIPIQYNAGKVFQYNSTDEWQEVHRPSGLADFVVESKTGVSHRLQQIKAVALDWDDTVSWKYSGTVGAETKAILRIWYGRDNFTEDSEEWATVRRFVVETQGITDIERFQKAIEVAKNGNQSGQTAAVIAQQHIDNLMDGHKEHYRRMGENLDDYLLPGMLDKLKLLKQLGVPVYIVSANPFLIPLNAIETVGLGGYIEDVFAVTSQSLSDFEKEAVLRRISERHANEPGQILMIGDGLKDLQAARENDAFFIAVANSKEEESAFSAAGVDAILSGPKYFNSMEASDSPDVRLVVPSGLSVSKEEARSYQRNVESVFAQKMDETDRLLMRDDDQGKIKQAISGNHKDRFALSSLVLAGDNSDVYRAYVDVQDIIEDVLRDHAHKRGVYLARDQMHITIFVDEITRNPFHLSLEQISREMAQDASVITPFNITLVGPVLMPDGVVVMEYAITDPQFLHLRKMAENRGRMRHFPEGHSSFTPNIFHSNVAVITDDTLTWDEFVNIRDRVMAYRKNFQPINFKVNKISVASAIEKTRTFVEVAHIPLSSPVNEHVYAVGLASPRSKDVHLVGSKAANFAKLREIPGIKTPMGFSISTQMYDDFIESLNIDPLFDKLDELSRRWQAAEQDALRAAIAQDIDRVALAIRETIQNGELNEEQRGSIGDYYGRMGANVLVAVRSSSAAEDLLSASFAGQYNSFLGRRGVNEVIESVKNVWASNFGINPILYRNEHGIDHRKSKMGVLVLEMVDAQSAGTIFTVDLETGLPNITITSSYGLGEADVSGGISTDTWLVVPATGDILKRRLGKKEYRIDYDPARRGVVHIDNSSGRQTSYAIDQETAKKLARDVMQIQAYFQSQDAEIKALDVEYAIDAAGEIYYLQARPETALSKSLIDLMAVEEKAGKDFPIIVEGGITGSFGVATGLLRITDTIEEAKQKLQPGDIMVAPNTVSYWEQPMKIVNGMITEIGGVGSHTSVVARERGVPAIVGLPDAIAQLRKYEGQVVTIDALFRRVYLGRVPGEMIVRAKDIPTVYGSKDDASEEAHWKGASSGGQTIVAEDGSRWIGKPNEQTSRFLAAVHDRSHDWAADAFGLTRVHDRYDNNIYQVLFSDIHRWREQIREASLDELEEMYEIWLSITRYYLDVSRHMELSPESMKEWIDAYIAMNGVMNAVFPFNEVVSGQREHAYKEKGLKEPYMALSRMTIGADLRDTLSADSDRALHALVQFVQSRDELSRFLRGLDVAQIDEGKILEIRGKYPVFYQRLMEFEKNYRSGNVFALSMTAEWTVTAAVLKVIDILNNNFGGGEYRKQDAEDYFPGDSLFNRTTRLAALCNKLKQDAHHLKFRGQWKFMEVIAPFVEFLVREGVVASKEEIYEHPPEWLIAQATRYSSELASLKMKQSENFTLKPYDTEALRTLGPLNGKWGRVLSDLENRMVSPVKIANIRGAHTKVLEFFAKRYPKQTSEMAGREISVVSRDEWIAHVPDGRIVLPSDMMDNERILFQEIARQMESLTIRPTEAQQPVLKTIQDVEEVLGVFGMPEDQRSRYLDDAEKFYSGVSARLKFYHVIRRALADKGDKFGALQEMLPVLISQNVTDAKGPLASRMRVLGDVFVDDLGFLKKLWGERHPGDDLGGFFDSFFEESMNSGVAPSLIILGVINLDQPDDVVDSLLLKRRWQIDLDATPIDYVFVGGGGYNSGTISRSLKWIREHEKLLVANPSEYHSANIASTWDRGGSSQKDADAVRNRFSTHVISPGDIMTVLSFQSITDERWFKKEQLEDLIASDYKPENYDAVMDLLYTYKNRLTVPENTTLMSLVEKRLADVNANEQLSKPANWTEFMVNFRKAAQIIDEELIDRGYLDGIRDQYTSVQNLLLMALVVAFDLDQERASYEILHIMGLKDIFALPASFEDAVQAMKVQDPFGNVKDEIIGHLNVANENEAYVFGQGEDQYIGKPYKWVLKDGEDDASGRKIQDVLPEDYPQTNPDAETVIRNCQRAIVTGMSSSFDSTLSNLMLKGVVDAIKEKTREGVPSFYFPKIITELQIEQLTLREILEVWERSIQAAQGDPDFRIQDILTHVFIPHVPEQLWNTYLNKLKETKSHLLTGEGKAQLQAITIKDKEAFRKVRDIFSDRNYWNADTQKKVRDGWYKIAKLIPGTPFEFSQADVDFLKSRGIEILEISDQEHQKMYRIWEERGVYNTNQVARVLDRTTEAIINSRNEIVSSTVFSGEIIGEIVAAGGEALRSFLGLLSAYTADPEHSPYANIAHYKNLWEEVERFKKFPEEFTNEQLVKREKRVPRIEMRGGDLDGAIANFAIIGVPTEYSEHVMRHFHPLEQQGLLQLTPGGAMTVEITKKGVDKALAIDYAGRYFDDILSLMQYHPGPFINARRNKTAVFVDADGTIYGKPKKDRNPALAESVAKEAIRNYLEAGGVLVIVSNNDLDRVLARIGNSIPVRLKRNIVVVGNASADLSYFDANGAAIVYQDYRQGALRARKSGPVVTSLDAVYIADGAGKGDGDDAAYQEIGFGRSIIVASGQYDRVSEDLQPNYVGGLEVGTKAILDSVQRLVRQGFQGKLFTAQNIQTIVKDARKAVSEIIIPDRARLQQIMQEFQRQMDKGSSYNTLLMGSAHINNSTGNETGDFVAVDWGGTNVRVMMVRLTPGERPQIIKSIRGVFQDVHKSGKNNPFDFVAGLIKQLSFEDGEDYSLGLAFSQPLKQNGANSALILDWVKGWNIPDFRGQDAGVLMQSALERSGLGNIKVKALVNDVVATQLSVPGASVGFVFGTGCALTIMGPSGEIIMTESGGFDSVVLPKTKFDMDLYDNALPRKEQAFEKMVSGAYVGKLFRGVVGDKLVGLDLGDYSDAQLSEMISHLETWDYMNEDMFQLHGDMINTFDAPTDMPYNDLFILKDAARLISARAGRMIGAIIFAAIQKQDPEMERDHIVAVDGSVYSKNLRMREYIDAGIAELRPGLANDRGGRISFQSVPDASALGAAVAAASAIRREKGEDFVPRTLPVSGHPQIQLTPEMSAAST